MKRYLLQYQRNADELMQEDDLGADSNNEMHEAFNKMTGELNLATSGYSVPACLDIINEDLEGYTVNNRKVKSKCSLRILEKRLVSLIEETKQTAGVLFNKCLPYRSGENSSSN